MRNNRTGFTLIELIIVLLVLASLAALVVPTLGFVKDQSDKSLAANGAQQVLNNLETYKAATGRYPDRLDTMVTASGDYFSAAYGTSAGLFPYGTIGTVPAYAFVNGGGVTQLAVADESLLASGGANDAHFADSTTNLSSFGGPSVCIIDGTSQPFYGGNTRRIVNACFPNQIDASAPVVPAGHTLVALGVGALNGAVGATMTQPPLCPEQSNSDPDNYDRFIAVFDAVASGGPAGRGQLKLKCVLDSEWKPVAWNIKQYKASGPDDDFGSAP